ncbi:hypothetical protein [Rhodoplanes serenus]|uniref:hypothetical protein n=1 Tax=Rhodoplanes serenus TaxID=200615 RepID=UPI000DAB6086|nr:hypothetical protein [Rhodoplanes serenus]RAI35129.1 hypothetical protein CH340_06845 [Rhodoplanes serenus]
MWKPGSLERVMSLVNAWRDNASRDKGWRDVSRPDPASRRDVAGPEGFGILALAAVALALIGARLLPSDLALPALSLAALVAAGVLALTAWAGKAPRRGDVSAWDVAGVLALLGFSAAMLSEAEHVVTAFNHTLVAMAP